MKPEIIQYIENIKKLGKSNLVIDNRILSFKTDYKFIIIGDNPGKNEKEHQQYFHPNGQAGQFAESFIKLTNQVFCKKEEILLLNKTPYHSSITRNLIITGKVKQSIKHLIILLENISLKNTPILIIGCGENKLNKEFYQQLSRSKKINFDNIYFGKHFSRGHFHKDFLKHLSDNLNDQKINFLQTLSTLKEETISKINTNFNLSF